MDAIGGLFLSLRHLASAKNSHFLAISTETGYLFLRTAPALNIKPQVPPHVSCPGHNPRHRAIPLAPWALNEGKEVPTNKHLTSLSLPLPLSPSLCFFLSFFLPRASNRLPAGQLASELLYYFSISLSVCVSLHGMPRVGGVTGCCLGTAQLDL